MEIHYNAFISYRHHPDDIRVASEIHRCLERFRIPKAIRKKAKGITRLFRDKEELPITSNLTDDIAAALRNSDFLIVICSVHTKESIWVQREIELFLQTHDRSRVLTVLASGEPYDVIPEILLHEDITDPVTGQTQRLPVEPLSCDWRMAHRKAKTEELPRLAAALLGCGYDELRQRQRQYRTRRLVAVFSAALAVSLCLSAYFLYTTLTIREANLQIQENLNRALQNQSLHLATAADERLADGDRLTAIALAMAALPSENNDRPCVPEAEEILTAALGVYKASADIAAVSAISPGANVAIQEFWATENDILYIFDQRGILTAWDTDTTQKLGAIDLREGGVETLLATPEGNAVIVAQNNRTLQCFQPDGQLLWQLEDCSDAALLSDGNTLMVITGIYHQEYQLRFIDLASGEESREPIVLDATEDVVYRFRFYQDTYCEELPIAIECGEVGTSDLYLIDIASGAQDLLISGMGNAACIAMSEDGKLFVMVSDGTGMDAGFYSGNRLSTSCGYDIFCYDMQEKSLLWESEMVSYTYTGDHTMEPIPQSGRLLCQTGNVFQILDCATGEILSRCETGSSILSVNVGTDTATAVLQDGFLCVYSYEENACFEYKCMASDLRQAQIGRGYFGLQSYGTQVIIYRVLESEPAWAADVSEYFYSYAQRVNGKQLVFTDFDYLYLFDTEEKTVRWKRERVYGDLLDFSTDASKFWMTEGSSTLCTIDTATGESVSEDFPGDPEDTYFSYLCDGFLYEDHLYYLIRNSSTIRLVCWDLLSGEVTASSFLEEVREYDSSEYGSEIAACRDGFIWIYLGCGELYEVNLQTGASQMILEGLTQVPDFAFREDGDGLAITNGSEIFLRTPGTQDSARITLDSAKAGALCFCGEEILALCDDGYMYRFDPSGTLLSQTKLTVYDTFSDELLGRYSDPAGISWHFTQDHKLILNLFSIANVIDLDSWKCCAEVSGYITYFEDENCFICQTGSGLAAYPRYTIDELLAIAQTHLNGFALTQEQKISYGID